MKLVCISDTHMHWPVLPAGDCLVHAGDMTYRGRPDELTANLEWWAQQPHPHKVAVLGNHDLWEQDYDYVAAQFAAVGVVLLFDQGITLDGVKFWGSPVQPRFFDWAFNRDPGPDIQKHWNLIPTGIDVLITHGPPWGVLDLNTEGLHCGCPDLLEAIVRTTPKVHVFGHIHEAYGERQQGATRFVNASVCNRSYNMTNLPMEVTV